MGIREAFQSVTATTPDFKKVPMPELADQLGRDYVVIVGMTGTDRDSYEASLLVGRGRRRQVEIQDMRAKLVVRCLVDDETTRKRIFADDEYVVLTQVRADLLDRMFSVAQRLSGISDEDLEELGKSSSSPSGTSSSSASPGASGDPSV